MSIKYREFLLLLRGSAGAVALGSVSGCEKKHTLQQVATTVNSFLFQPIKGAIPIETADFKPQQQKEIYSTYEVVDDLLLPQDFQYQVIAVWGDKVGDSRFGYNNDYLSFVPTTENERYLSVKFEYISAIPRMQKYQQLICKSLPFAEVKTALKRNASGKNEINAYALPDNNSLKAKIKEICSEALLDQGLGIISIRKTAAGKWERTNSTSDRRISRISGLKDKRYLKATFLAVQHPGESNGIRIQQASQSREFLVTTTTGEEFMQTPQVPIGSNCPSKTPNFPPKPAAVAITKFLST